MGKSVPVKKRPLFLLYVGDSDAAELIIQQLMGLSDDRMTYPGVHFGLRFRAFDVIVGHEDPDYMYMEGYRGREFYAAFVLPTMDKLDLPWLKARVRGYDEVYPEIPIWFYDYVDLSGFVDVFDLEPAE